MIIRCSSLPRLFRCGQSALLDVLPSEDVDMEAMESDCAAARVGTATHEMIRAHFGGHLTGEVAQNICAGNGVQQAEVWPLVNTAKRIVAEMGLGAPDVMEDAAQDGDLTGHPDAEWTAAGAYWIGDWKTSRLDPDYFHQLMGYAWLRRACIRALAGGCNLFVAWLRDGTVTRYHVTFAGIEKWKADLDAKRAETKRPYVTGAHCSFCPRCPDCPAQREDMRQALAVIGDDVTLDDVILDVAKLDGATVAKVHRKLKMLATVKAHWDEALKNRIRSRGPIDCGDGFTLAIVPEKGKREIDTLKAWPELAKRLTDEELAPCLKVGVTALQDAVIKKAPPRKGAEAKRQLWADLEAAGAVDQGTVEKLKEVRTQNLLDTKEITR